MSAIPFRWRRQPPTATPRHPLPILAEPSPRSRAAGQRSLARSACALFPVLLAILLPGLLLCPLPALADGGHIALHSSQGAYTITLFTAPNPLIPGPADLSLLVEDADTGAILTDATADLRLSQHPGQPLAPSTAPDTAPGTAPGTALSTAQTTTLALTHASATNPLLLAASPRFFAPGIYQLAIRVTRPGAPPAEFTTQLTVTPDHRRRTTLLFAFLLPAAVVALFLLNQHAKRLSSLRRVPTR